MVKKITEIKTSSTTTTTTIDTQLESDRQLLLKLRRVTRATTSEQHEIFYMYKKYIDPNAKDFCGGCNGGAINSIQRFYYKVIALNL